MRSFGSRLVACACSLLACACSADSRVGAAPVGGTGRGAEGATGGIAAGAGIGAAAAVSGGGGHDGQIDASSIINSSCFRHRVASEIVPANLLFVIDRSGSMVCNPPPTTDSAACERDMKRVAADLPSKWEITQRAVVEVMQELPETARVGVSYFSNDQSCGVHPTPAGAITRNSETQRQLIQTLLAEVSPGGATPLVGATILAYQHLHTLDLRGDKFVVLITDGKQSEACDDPPRCSGVEQCTNLLIDSAARAAGPGVGIRTFVIGAPGSEMDSRTLSRIAQAGGTKRDGCTPDVNCHFDVTKTTDFSASLKEALRSIVGQTPTCDIEVPNVGSTPYDPERVNLLYKPNDDSAETILRRDDSAPCDHGARGWQYAEGKSRIRLCGDVCTTVRANRGGRLDVIIGCPVVGPD